MTIPGLQLAAADTMELTEPLGLLIDSIDSDHDNLRASLRRFTGNDAYDTSAPTSHASSSSSAAPSSPTSAPPTQTLDKHHPYNAE